MFLELNRALALLVIAALPCVLTGGTAQQIPLGGIITGPPEASVAPTVTLTNGTYHGRHSVEYEQDHFLGIPFAEPPVGALRFAPPQPLSAAFTEPRNATDYGPECIGYGYDQWILGNRISEDCLTINIVRPAGTSEADNLPVAVWIHGGVSAAVVEFNATDAAL